MAMNSRLMNFIRQWWPFVLVALLVLLAFVVPDFYVHLITRMMTLVLFAVAYNLTLGYGGMLSFGHGAYYGFGAYVTAILMVRAAMPLPLAFLGGIVGAALLGLGIGYFCVKLRRFYFAILTLAFSQLVWAIIYKWYDFTGGSNGMIGVQLPPLLVTGINFYLFTLFIVLICLIILRRIVDSPFGVALRSIRENPERAEFVGINVNRYRLMAFTISAFFSGVAGALMALFSRGAFPEYVAVAKGIEPLIASLLGGLNTFYGPVVGSVVILGLDNYITKYTEYWPLVLGILLVLLTLFLPEGILGFIQGRRHEGRKKAVEEVEA